MRRVALVGLVAAVLLLAAYRTLGPGSTVGVPVCPPYPAVPDAGVTRCVGVVAHSLMDNSVVDVGCPDGWKEDASHTREDGVCMPKEGVEGQELLVASRGDGCFTSGVTGMLVANPTYGTAIARDARMGGADRAIPVAWSEGYTGHWVGSEYAVLDRAKNVVAMTGRRYRLEGGYANEGSSAMTGLPDDFRGFWACGDVR